MRLRVTLLILFSLFLASPASAHDGIFFEYAPDAWASKRHSVLSDATPYQLFQPTSDFLLTGFDFWVDNTESSGSVTFTLSDSDNATIATKNITLPQIASIAGGTKHHIDLTNSQTLHGGQTYSIQITTQLPGMGLYYADRINFLEHNRLYTTPYTHGAARLGSTEQNFTFKFALHSPDVAGGEDEEPEQEPPATPSSTVVSISNARIADVGANTVTAAWTTNIAADSRITLRTQLNPLYITHTITDATLELEHTLTVHGLSPNTNYFADVYSSQGETLVLSTYTLSFKTDPGAPPVPPAAPATTTTTPSQSATSSTPTSSSTLPGLGVGAQGLGTVEVTWSAPTDGEPSNDYRIDIFDENRNLERQITVPSGTHSKEITQLAGGEHHIVVYANDNGVYEKVATPTTFSLNNRASFLNIIILVSLLAGAGIGGYMFYKSRKTKSALPPEETTATL
jgi:hypothetical protein